MGKITSTKTDIHGVKTRTQVHTNRFEDFLINTVGRLFGREREWQFVHRIEKRKLRKQ